MFVPIFPQSSKIFFGRYENNLPVGFSNFVKLDGLVRVINVEVKGKFMWWELGPDYAVQPTWWMHCTYGMSGRWETYTDRHVAENNKHVVTLFRCFQQQVRELAFVDHRHFGTIKFISDKKLHDKKLDSLGPDMLGDPPNDDTFKACLVKKNVTLPEALMNQSTISGVGNYIKAEALYRAKLSPHRLTRSLNDDELLLLKNSIIDVMNEAYRSKGATIKSYVTPDGTKGAAQFQFRVYGRKKDPEGNIIIKEVTKDRRTTHWVQNVQR